MATAAEQAELHQFQIDTAETFLDRPVNETSVRDLLYNTQKYAARRVFETGITSQVVPNGNFQFKDVLSAMDKRVYDTNVNVSALVKAVADLTKAVAAVNAQNVALKAQVAALTIPAPVVPAGNLVLNVTGTLQARA